jgi:LemA protein
MAMKGTGYILLDFREKPHLIIWSILAGMLWAVANTLTIFAIRDVGLSIAFPLWNTNSLVGLGQGVDAQWAQVQNVYQRRADLVPNLVATVKGYAAHEREVLEAVTESRSKVGSMRASPDMLNSPAEMAKFQQAQESLGSALSRLLLVVERYPDLKANQNFLELQSQLEGTENRIAVERKRFNESAQVYNTRIKQFPANIAAGFFRFKEKAYFEAAPGSEKAPVVDFLIHTPLVQTAIRSAFIVPRRHRRRPHEKQEKNSSGPMLRMPSFDTILRRQSSPPRHPGHLRSYLQRRD